MAITRAKTGRRTKKRENIRRCLRHFDFGGFDLLARRHFAGSFDNQPVAALQAVDDKPFVAVGFAGFHAALFNLVISVNHQRGGIAFGIAGNALLRGEDRIVHDAFVYAGANEHPRQQHVLRIGKDRAQRDRAGRFIHRHFGQRQATFSL